MKMCFVMGTRRHLALPSQSRPLLGGRGQRILDAKPGMPNLQAQGGKTPPCGAIPAQSCRTHKSRLTRKGRHYAIVCPSSPRWRVAIRRSFHAHPTADHLRAHLRHGNAAPEPACGAFSNKPGPPRCRNCRVTVSLELPSGRTYEHSGVAEFESAEIDRTTDMLTVWAEFSNPDNELVPGLKVRVTAHVSE